MKHKIIAGAVGATLALVGALPAARAGEVTIVAKEFSFTPNEIIVTTSENVTLIFINEGVLSHNLAIPALDIQTDTVQSGDTVTMTFAAPKTGTFQFSCLVPGHFEAGMEGHIMVTPKQTATDN